MDAQTRNLVSLLANEETEALLEALDDGPATVQDLAAALGSSEPPIASRLRELERWGMVSGRKRPSDGPGPRSKEWRRRGQLWERFEQIADAFTLEQIEAEAERLRQVIDQRQRARVEVVDEDSEEAS